MRQRMIILAVLALIVVAGVAIFLSSRHQHSSQPGSSQLAEIYTCPMHPFVVKDKPGTCPVCAMELVKKSTTSLDLKQSQLPEHIFLSPTQQVLANLEITNVMYKPIFKVINASGIITFDQTRQGKVSAWGPGRIERLHAPMVGVAVTKGKPVAELNSPELVSAEEDYLLHYRDTVKTPSPAAEKENETPLYRARQRLRQLGFMEAQFKELESSGKPSVLIPLYPPVNGIVTSKEIQLGQYVKAGDQLFGIADPTQVWGELDIFEDEFPFLKIGQDVLLTTRAYPGREFAGRVSFIYPSLDARTKTARVRVSVANQHLLLKPEMLVQAKIQIPLGTALAVPAEAVISMGDRYLVWVQASPGTFVPREVKVGVRYKDDVQILAGVNKDEVVAASGAYLIDSEAQLKSADRALPVKTSPKTTSSRNGMKHGEMHQQIPAADELNTDSMKMEERIKSPTAVKSPAKQH